MVASWGGYAFIINMIPIFNIYLCLADRMTTRAFVAYISFYIIGTLLAMQIPFVGA
jgi:dolichyl-diphosphooligosaccharide--protein glycosyltransferase